MPDVKPWFKNITRGIETEKFIDHSSGGSTWHALRGHTGVSVRVQTERKIKPGVPMPLLGSVGEVLWSFQSMARLVNSNPKSLILINHAGILSKGRIGGKCWKAWMTVDHKGRW